MASGIVRGNGAGKISLVAYGKTELEARDKLIKATKLYPTHIFHMDDIVVVRKNGEFKLTVVGEIK